jgi:nitroimidazol reductase NimA-like FMN-containing flavoprotein (pyridoxamine 5'-phosphate oxidase superfamily)
VAGGTGCQCTARYKCIVGFGTASIVEDAEETRHGLEVLMRQYADAPQRFDESTVAKTVVVRVDIEEMTGKQSPAPKG